MNSRSILTGLTALSLLTSLSACKPVRSEQGAKPAQGTQTAQAAQDPSRRLEDLTLSNLQIGFYLSNPGSTIPDFDRPAPGDFLEGAVTDGQTLQLKKRLGHINATPQEGPLFLTFSDTFGTHHVVDASYEHRAVSVSNQTQDSSHRALVSYDRDSHRYFLSLDDILNRNGDGISSLDLQVLNLNLSWSDGSVSHFEIRFYAKGDLPSLDKVRLLQSFNEPNFRQGNSAQKLTAVTTASHGGWAVLTEHYKNPISRPLTLWFSNKDLLFQVVTQLGMRIPGRFNEISVTDDAGFQAGLRQISMAKLDRAKLVVRDSSSHSSQSFQFSSDSRIPVRINPGQELEIEWRVFASEDIPLCQDGGPASWNFRACRNRNPEGPMQMWAAETPGCENPGGMFDQMYQLPSPVAGTWEVQSYQVSGQFKNDVILTEDIGTQEQALVEAEKEGITLSIPVSVKKFGDGSTADASLPQYSCQGIF